ncbi:hypothetical protein MCAP1_003419 [Malassezia caprae]|uniref:Uncharacterized protein n=1 Tax=Malassezia caprae TaxID=1381934 RepID=A0AAF0J1L8_9BASI|nr:hypothetical protein MCAP1_003419 [Malassezia caprae]
MIPRGWAAALLAASVVWGRVPTIEPGAVRHVQEHEPWRIESFNAAKVNDRVRLDTTERCAPGAHSAGWADPGEHGGSMLDIVGNGFREPINVIISGQSDKGIMSDQGLLDYARSIGFSFECLHLHLGGLQHANLGDGRGYTPQLFEYRSILFHDSPGAWIGACWESLAGGNHFRVWRQNGTLADTGAWFLAVSKEEDVFQEHTISPNGYDVGRNLLVDAATRGSSFKGKSWRASVEWKTGLLPTGSQGINHNISLDGRVAILHVRRTDLQ